MCWRLPLFGGDGQRLKAAQGWKDTRPDRPTRHSAVAVWQSASNFIDDRWGDMEDDVKGEKKQTNTKNSSNALLLTSLLHHLFSFIPGLPRIMIASCKTQREQRLRQRLQRQKHAQAWTHWSSAGSHELLWAAAAQRQQQRHPDDWGESPMSRGWWGTRKCVTDKVRQRFAKKTASRESSSFWNKLWIKTRDLNIWLIKLVFAKKESSNQKGGHQKKTSDFGWTC